MFKILGKYNKHLTKYGSNTFNINFSKTLLSDVQNTVHIAQYHTQPAPAEFF